MSSPSWSNTSSTRSTAQGVVASTSRYSSSTPRVSSPWASASSAISSEIVVAVAVLSEVAMTAKLPGGGHRKTGVAPRA
jgi:hypothetical protein